MKKIFVFLVALTLALSFVPGVLALAVDNVYSNEFVGANEMYEEFIIPAIQGDAEALDFTFEKIGKYSICSDGNYKVAIALSNTSFHWYRQNPDGTWSHKPGNNNVTKYDAANRIIYDPEVANRNYSDVNYNRFIGFFEVSPLNNMY